MIYTSYMQNVKNIPKKLKRVSIMRYTPLWTKDIIQHKLTRLSAIAPTLLGYRNGLITRGQYIEYYKQHLDTLDIKTLIPRLDNHVLLCTCKTGTFCHRHVLVEYLRNKGYEITEYMPPYKKGFFNIKILTSYTENSIQAFPDYTFVFGDNIIKKGKKGQAIIRDYPNSFGIPTKRLPSLKEEAYFSDKEDELVLVNNKLEELKRLLVSGTNIVIPKNGIGTGLAELEQRSPLIYETIKEFMDINIISYYLANTYKRRILIVGSREYKNKKKVFKDMTFNIGKIIKKNTLIITGDAKGIDHMALEYSDSNNIDNYIYQAYWKLQGKRAGMMRNIIMSKIATEAIVFWNGKSPGTKQMIRLLEKENIPYKLIKIK